MKKKNFKKKLSTLFLCLLTIVGAAAWLFDTDVATGVNNIVPGQAIIEFAEQENIISLINNDAIPMTEAYALTNVTPYSFEIKNAGDVDLDYKIYATEVTSTLPKDKIHILISSDDGATYTDAGMLNEVEAMDLVELTGVKEIISNTINSGEDNQAYKLIAYIDSSVELDDYISNSASFKLVVVAVQNEHIVIDNRIKGIKVTEDVIGKVGNELPYTYIVLEPTDDYYFDQTITANDIKVNVEGGLKIYISTPPGPYEIDVDIMGTSKCEIMKDLIVEIPGEFVIDYNTSLPMTGYIFTNSEDSTSRFVIEP